MSTTLIPLQSLSPYDESNVESLLDAMTTETAVGTPQATKLAGQSANAISDILNSTQQNPSTQTMPQSSESLMDSLTSPFTQGVNTLSSIGKFTSSITLENIVAIIVGLILIAAGLFSFKTTSTVIQTVGRAAVSGSKTIGELSA
jgi:hypothetical protein